MANIWMRGFKFPNPILPLRNLNFVQRGLPPLPKGDTGEDTCNLAEKTTSIFVGKPKYGGLIQHAATTSSKGPRSIGGNPGSPPTHNEHPPTGKGTENAGKDVSDSKNREKKQEETNK